MIQDKSLEELNSEYAQIKNSSRIISRVACDIKSRPINWLWVKRFARGKISLIAGDPGIGKSQLITSMTATITTGRPFPDGTPSEVGNVLILSAEDDAEDTIVPRLISAGADTSRVHIIDAVKDENNEINPFFISDDLLALESKIIEIGNISAIFIDPISAYLGGKIDDKNNSSVRSVLLLLSKLAEKYNIAIIFVTHLNKDESKSVMQRVMGSKGFIAAVRAGFLVARAPDGDDKKRLFLPIKNNIGNDSTGLSFVIEECELDNNIKVSKIIWNDEIITQKADDILNPLSIKNATALEEAEEFLQSTLSHGQVLSNDLFQLAKEEGISEVTLRRALKKLQVIATREGFGEGGKVYRALPVSPETT